MTKNENEFGMKLNELLQDIAESPRNDIEVQGLCLNTGLLEKGEAFIAIPGEKQDGRSYINQAIQKGASAILCEEASLNQFKYDFGSPIPVVPVKRLGERLDKLAIRFYGNPSKDLHVIGVTGTNGKTTTTFLLATALSKLGKPCCVLGTLGVGFVKNLSKQNLTTPDMLSLQKYLYDFKRQGALAVAMEVSSHGLAQKRVQGIAFRSAHFTNLTQDHLDYHGTMESYGRAKQKLFQFASLKHAVVNMDSPYANKIISVMRRDLPIAVYSTSPKISVSLARNTYSLVVDAFTLDQKGIVAQLNGSWGKAQLRSPLWGEFNLSNLLGVICELCLMGYSLKEVCAALTTAQGAPGRMERFGLAHTPQIIIDYAHTPDALEAALKAAKVHCKRKLWCIFGCGGNRDKEKRAMMGAAAFKHADKIVLTNDNPRNEEPMSIIQDILKGIEPEHKNKVHIELSRLKAIEHALMHALPVDTILIAGKGHEDYQIIGDKTYAFSDKACVQSLLGETQ